MKNKFTVIIVGAGPSGVGIAKLLADRKIDYLVLEKGIIGNSFSLWPKNMKMITPSFPSNAFGQMDLNSVAENSSPGYFFGKEHLSGVEYSEYLLNIKEHFNLNIKENIEVLSVYKDNNSWRVETNEGQYFGKYVIWAAGEFNNPNYSEINGFENCVHSSQIKNVSSLKGDEYVVVGGYESGVQVAYDLIKLNKKVTLINQEKINNLETSDPSKVLSPFTLEKYRELIKNKNYKEIVSKVDSVLKDGKMYKVCFENKSLYTKNNPILATGFKLVILPIAELVKFREDNFPLLKSNDEFVGQENMYLAGPSVRHEGHIFCFIYKFRQRFGVVLEDIMRKEGFDKKEIKYFVESAKKNGLYLKNLKSCSDECVC